MAALEATFTLFSSYPSFSSSKYAYPLRPKASSSINFQISRYTPIISPKFPLVSSVKHSRKSRFEVFTAVQEEIEVEEKAENVQLYQKRKLFVYNLPWSLTVADIKNLFGECGTVIDVEIIKQKNGKSRGFAFVTMSSAEEAQAVIEKFNSQELSGRVITVEFAKRLKKLSPPPPDSAPPGETRYKLYVSNLAWKVRANDLREFFAVNFKPVSTRVIFNNNPSGNSAGYGFVSFATREEAENAISDLNGKFSIQTKGLPVQNPLPIRTLYTAATPKAETEMELSQAEAVVNNTQNYQDDLQKLGLRIKQHEDHIKFLKTQKNILEDSILDMQVAIGKYHTSTESVTEKEDTQIEEGTYEHLNQEKSAAGLIWQLKARHEIQVSHSPLVKDVLGIVATLGKVDDENLGRLLAEYLGKRAMAALVCKTFDGVKAMESYDKEGVINRSSGLHGIGSSVGRTLEVRFLVICLNDLRPYVGEFVADDPQRRLDLLKPKLPGGEIPHGFVGYAVNLVHIDNQNLFCVTNSGHGLRETLFYHLFSHLQVYRTREEMQQALPFIDNGAVSLDGGIIRSPGVFDLGDREEAQVKFPRISGKSSLPENYYEIENNLKSKKWNQERLLDDMRREQSFLDQAKYNFEIKKKAFVRFLAQSSQYASAQYAPAQQQQSPAGRERFTPR